MGKYKDEHGKSKIGDWIKTNAPHLIDVVGDILPDKGALGIVKNIIQKDDKISDAKKLEANNIIESDLKAFALEIDDRKDARDLFKIDNSLQKIFAITFLTGYMFISGLMLYGAYMIAIEGIKLDNYLVALITTMFTAMSMKVNTIVDFLFGGSFK